MHSYIHGIQIIHTYIHIGDWFEDKMEGQGTYVWHSGEVYMGEYRNNVRHGKGRMTYADGSVKPYIHTYIHTYRTCIHTYIQIRFVL